MAPTRVPKPTPWVGDVLRSLTLRGIIRCLQTFSVAVVAVHADERELIVAEIRPFRGIRFNTERVGGLREVVGPPEDIPSPEQAEVIVAGKPYHAVRLEMSDPGPGECFTLASHLFRAWLRDGVLIQGDHPAFYVHEHEFEFDGERRVRCGVFAALHLSDYAERVVLPHENTMPHNVEIRTELLRDVRANLSAVYTLIQDRGTLEAMLTNVHDRTRRMKPA